jgi:hypothetical protein
VYICVTQRALSVTQETHPLRWRLSGGGTRARQDMMKRDPEAVIRVYESGKVSQTEATLAQYVKALVEVDRLDHSKLMSHLRQGMGAGGGGGGSSAMQEAAMRFGGGRAAAGGGGARALFGGGGGGGIGEVRRTGGH